MKIFRGRFRSADVPPQQLFGVHIASLRLGSDSSPFSPRNRLTSDSQTYGNAQTQTDAEIRSTTDMTRDPVHSFACHLLPPTLWSPHDNTNVISCNWSRSKLMKRLDLNGLSDPNSQSPIVKGFGIDKKEDHFRPQNISELPRYENHGNCTHPHIYRKCPQTCQTKEGSYGTGILEDKGKETESKAYKPKK